MRDSRDSGGGGLTVALAVVLALVLLGGVGVLFLWQLRQQSQVQRERAVAKAAHARAVAVAEQQWAEATRTNRALLGRPDEVGDDFETAEATIRSVLQSQQRAWNAGDIDRFMESYWKSDDLTFSSGGKLTRGWRGTLENYKQRYPSRAEMGNLSFTNLEIKPLGAGAALVLGEWQLDRESDILGGNFTLVFRLLGDEWVIVHDHTSRNEQP